MATSAGDLIIPEQAVKPLLCVPCKEMFTAIALEDPSISTSELKFRSLAGIESLGSPGESDTCQACYMVRYVCLGSNPRWRKFRIKKVFSNYDREVAPRARGLSHLRITATRKEENTEENICTNSDIYGVLFLSFPNGLAPAVVSRRPKRTPNIALAAEWYAQCTGQHSNCEQEIEQDLPNRIIDVGTSESEPRLVESRGLKGKYITLSYCWGDSQPMKTNMHNLASHMESMPSHSMPKTYQDAIVVTKSLGFQFLWIDALCIIQESDDSLDPHTNDWESEYLQMDKIYSNAALTISAPESPNVSAGFLGKRKLKPQESRRFDISLPDDRMIEMLLEGSCSKTGKEGETEMMLFEKDISILLDRRAWALQERVLPPRLLEFRRTRMTFACNTSTCCEGDQYPKLYEWFQSSALLLPKNVLKADLPKEVLWQWLVENHSRRDMSYGDDKLPSIAGVAVKLGHLRGDNDHYMAGMWRTTLHQDLSWQRSDLDKATHSKIPATLAQPSWSWASCKHAVNFTLPRAYDNLKHEFHIRLEHPWTESIWGNLPDTSCNRSIKLSGFLSSPCIRVSHGHKHTHEVHLKDFDDHRANLVIDDLDAADSLETVHLLLLASRCRKLSSQHDYLNIVMIALVPVSIEQETFRRVGLATIMQITKLSSSPLLDKRHKQNKEIKVDTNIVDWFHSLGQRTLRFV